MTGFVELGLAKVSNALIGSKAKIDLLRLAERCPPLNWAGFEIRLNSDTQVDLHLGHRVDASHDILVLNNLLHYFTEEQRIGLHQLCQDPLIIKNIEYLVLEFDVSENEQALPALFIAFHSQLTVSERLVLATKFLMILGNSQQQLACLTQVFSACHDGESITHIGIMLRGADKPLRVNIRNIKQHRLTPFLIASGYSGPLNEIETIYQNYIRLVDRLTLCIDVTDRVESKVGFECTLARQPSQEPRYQQVLQQLSNQQLCLSEKATDILSWPGISTPIKDAKLWPEYMLVELLLQEPQTIKAIELRISHIKLTYQPLQPLTAKAYLGLEFVKILQQITSNNSADSTAAMVTQATLQNTVQQAIRFFKNGQHQSGFWLEYNTFPIAPTDEWPTAYIGYILSQLALPEALTMAKQAWRTLSDTRSANRQGWGWNQFVAPDSDSTAWALLLQKNINAEESPDAEEIYKFLASHQHKDGGIITYLASHFALTNQQSNADVSVRKGWLNSAVCVTAVVARLLSNSNALIPYLSDKQQFDGSWQGLWWPDHEFTTALVIQTLVNKPTPLHLECIRKASVWALARVGKDGAVFSNALQANSPFATANTLSILCHAVAVGVGDAHCQVVMDNLAAWLIKQQLAAGSWNSSALLYIEPEGSAILYADNNSFHTTATVLAALNAYQLLRQVQ